MSLVEGKLATLVDEIRVAINRGSASGAQEGDVVTLFRTVQVDDPETGESLGSVDVKKLTLEVETVREKMCVAVVVDLFYADGESNDFVSSILRPKRRKRVAYEVKKGDRRTVQVEVGEKATIDISSDENEETESEE